MKCPMCDDTVYVLNNTPKGEACYLCVKKYNLLMIGYDSSFRPEKEIKRKNNSENKDENKN